jgi:hypothetical protein
LLATAHAGYDTNIGDKTMKIRTVTLHSRHGVIERVLVEEAGDVVVVCRVDEFMAALADGRAPATVGFKRESVVAFGELAEESTVGMNG